MRALTWQKKGEVAIEEVADPVVEHPTDAVVRLTSTALCGSDLHLYTVLAPYLSKGDILGHEGLGVVESVGDAVSHVAPGDRVVIPFNISCGTCRMCRAGLQSQCETTQVTAEGKGAALFGYTRLYGAVPGCQAERVRVPHADYGLVKLADDAPDEHYLYLSDILPTAWQAVQYAGIEPGSTAAIIGLGPVGQLAAACAQHLGAGKVIGVDLVPERLARAAARGVHTIDVNQVKDVASAVHDLTDGRGADGVVDAVGMEAHGNPIAHAAISATSSMPAPLARAATERFGIDRLSALHTAIASTRRGGTVSISGVYGGMADPMPMMQMFDKQLTVRMGQANVRRWTDELHGLLANGADPFGVDDLRTHRLPLSEAPAAYEMFQKKQDGCIKVVFDPTS
ncbi:zinc-dependent alcohol dehydrogenase [Cumulibacter manganitolerans]|uniref:zinc-dependent alcohol dehydrogenase n=1 Tax=Cumulibacter manganitolerans TaxID=1884992 RepID=UPI001295BE14|nr:zinc-dependent alcohol dehydrogenase [Cumulibacter manganitolerans]